MKEVKVVRFNARHNIDKGERELNKLVNEGWVIVSVGGVQHDAVVVLQRG